ncbi:MAG: hydrogenase nickel incorporation protein HypB [Erysipelotrichaceae bacterium]|nr:hydrogenase nickel incorporation protein HypB [Erysipelotrichaceae bacterium]
MAKLKTIEVHENVFADNIRTADNLRKMFKDNGTLFLNVMSAPGSGKTTLLTALINKLKGELRIGEMDVDIKSDLDARRVAEATGIDSLQIHNGGLCHIDADMVSRAIREYDVSGYDLLILENIGNLVCPAEFDTGAHKRVMLLSIPEGDDKPLKYPLMFKVSDLVLISKIDTIEYFDFDMDKAIERIKHLNPECEIIKVSAKTGEGIDEVIKWIRKEYAEIKKV